ncbi:retrovirus-related Pol polyprotein from transposon opus [Trichonephila clavipes]|uniref:RNA-directed DNA polymerase n=1 Tax=Trichonephila clavipes TaxID=2585209 RepID=A0A8X7BHW4_TRICX|nr:retrovirus-related Pol polyprotein from transposon opus [Trichonephila clavipes]
MKLQRNSMEVSKFLGMSQWYANFIKNYADICEPLYNLKRKLKRFIWSIDEQKAFDAVKAAITKAPVLKFPDFKKPFELFTDASSIGVGAVLNQEQRPVVFASRTLSAAERNYTVTQRECLAVVWALNKFRTYLGSLPIKVITDHAALTRLTNGKNLSNRMMKWALKLAELNIEWEHHPGTQNTVADVLSRNPIENIIGEKVNCAIIKDLVRSSRDQLIEEQRTDPELGHIYRYLENPEDSSVNAAIWYFVIGNATRWRIRTGSSDSNSSRQESSSFDRVQRRSNESQYGRYKRSRESGSGEPERKIRKGSGHRVPKRALSSNYTTNSNLPKFTKRRREETVAPKTSGYNLRPRGGKGVESRPAMEMKTQQGGPVRARKSKGRNYNPYIEKRTRSDNRNARRRGDQQRRDQERKGASTSRSIFLEV